MEQASAQLPTAAAQGNSWEKLDRCKARVPQPGSVRGAVCAHEHPYMCVCLCVQPSQLSWHFRRREDGVGKTVAHEEPFKEKDLGSADDLTLQQV